MAEQSIEIKEPKKIEKRFSMSQHAGSGAVFATLIATFWVLHYLVTTQYGFSAFGGVIGSSLLDYVTGQAHNLETFGSEALFVVVARFVIAFGLS